MSAFLPLKCLSCLPELNRHSAGSTSLDGGHLKEGGQKKSRNWHLATSFHSPFYTRTHVNTHVLPLCPAAHLPAPLSLTVLSVQEEAGWCVLMWPYTLDDFWLMFSNLLRVVVCHLSYLRIPPPPRVGHLSDDAFRCVTVQNFTEVKRSHIMRNWLYQCL